MAARILGRRDWLLEPFTSRCFEDEMFG